MLREREDGNRTDHVPAGGAGDRDCALSPLAVVLPPPSPSHRMLVSTARGPLFSVSLSVASGTYLWQSCAADAFALSVVEGFEDWGEEEVSEQSTPSRM